MKIDCGGFADMGAPPDLLAQTEPARQAYDHLVKDGYVVLERVLAPTTLAALDAAFAGRHDPPDDCFKIGGRRYVLPVELSGAFAEPLVYANPAIVAIVRVALDRSAVLKGFGAEVALPNAEPQPIDRNGRRCSMPTSHRCCRHMPSPASCRWGERTASPSGQAATAGRCQTRKPCPSCSRSRRVVPRSSTRGC
ncbi:hypothetical protein [Reyranella massiliensis]|uniref:hypothetical protein n=1 Tax=Reyranella massiliensis TaxID=445220 RepID=UPI0002FDE6A0|nr:hypothetical protein [Reyranella massiliensis]